jgi:hypothetical protein
MGSAFNDMASALRAPPTGLRERYGALTFRCSPIVPDLYSQVMPGMQADAAEQVDAA